MTDPMSTKRSTTIMPVRDLTASIAFYRDDLGFTLNEHDAEAGLAWIDANGYPVLLTGPGATGFASNPDEVHEVVRPGGTLYVFASNLDRLQTELAEHGVAGAGLVERSWGDRTLTVRDPDGYTVSFWTLIQRSPEQVLALYESGPDALDVALTGLSESDLDLASSPGGWTIRQIVQHLADLEAATLGQIMMAFAEPGRIYRGNPFNPDTWATSLDYAGRPIGSSVQLFLAIREHVVQLAHHLPDAWKQSSRKPDGPDNAISLTLSMLSSHALEHIEEIHETRRLHGR